MTSQGWAAVATCALAVAALLAFDARGRHAAAGACKVLASCAFVALGLLCAPEGPRGQLLLLSLVLCWLGDVLLIPRGATLPFALGLASFLLGHVGFAVGFGLRGVHVATAGAACLVAVPFGIVVMRWLGPRAGSLLWPVRAYVVTILVMAVLAAGATATTGDPRLVVGAVAFAISDLAVARERFVTSSPWNPRFGLPLYYAAVLLLAASGG